jgi:hypothetical protein
MMEPVIGARKVGDLAPQLSNEANDPERVRRAARSSRHDVGVNSAT